MSPKLFAFSVILTILHANTALAGWPFSSKKKKDEYSPLKQQSTNDDDDELLIPPTAPTAPITPTVLVKPPEPTKAELEEAREAATKEELSRASTSHEFLELFRKKEITQEHISEFLVRFFETSPSISEIVTLKERVIERQKDLNKTIDLLLAINLKGLTLVSSSDDFLNLLNLGTKKPAQAYLEEVSKFVIAHEELFFSYQPSLAQRCSLQHSIVSVANSMKIRQNTLSLVHSMDDFLELTSMDGCRYHAPRYKMALTIFIRDSITNVICKETTLDEFLRIQNYVFSLQEDLDQTIETLIALKEHYLRTVGRENEEEVLKPGNPPGKTPSEKYLHAII